MRIILEGPDNAGKTTLASRLIKACPAIEYHHPGGKPDDFQHELRCIEEQMGWLDSAAIIIDRVTPISQQVYNPDIVHDATRQEALKLMMAKNPIIIYCRPSTDRLMRFNDFTWREGESEEHKQKIIRNQHVFIERYDKIMRTVPCISYDFDDQANANLITKQLQSGLLGNQSAIAWFNGIINYR